MSGGKRIVAARKEAETWNARVPVGTPVEYRTSPQLPPSMAKTRTRAWVVEPGRVVVGLAGRAGGVLISQCTTPGGES